MPPPSHKLALVTAADAVLPPDGALVVRRIEVAGGPAPKADEAWIVRSGGRTLTVTVDAFAGGFERWAVPEGADPLEIVDESGKVIATIARSAPSATPLPAPQVARLTSNTARKTVAPVMGILGAIVTVQLRRPAPTGALLVVTGAGGLPYFTWPTTVDGKRFRAESYTRKSCTGGGPPTTFIGDRLNLRWLDPLGRISRPAQVTVQRAPRR